MWSLARRSYAWRPRSRPDSHAATRNDRPADPLAESASHPREVSRLASPIRFAVVRPERPLRGVMPPILTPRMAVRDVSGIKHLVARHAPLADHHHADIGLAVVDEIVRDAGAGGEGDGVACRHAMQPAVDPGIGLALQDEDELLFLAFGVRKAGAVAGQQALVMDADAGRPNRSLKSISIVIGSAPS